MDDQAITPSKPHYGVATLSVGIEHRFEGHEAYEGQGFKASSAFETARGRVVARMYDPADGRFVSRDPIGYAGSPWNLFEYVKANPTGTVDPDGLAPIVVNFGGFINSRLGTWFNEPVPGSRWQFKSDLRGFGGGSFRVYGRVLLDSKDIGNITRENSNAYVGSNSSTRRRPKAGGGFEYQYGTAPTQGGSAFNNTGGCETTFLLSASGTYPFAPRFTQYLAAVDFNVKLKFTVVGKNKVKISVSGWHDNFPDYEAVIVTPVQSSFYQKTSPATGPSPWPSSLGQGGNVQASGNTTIDVETCCNET